MTIIDQIISAVRITKKPLEELLSFSEIIGYDEIKDILRRALTSNEKVQIYLCGPAASGKSLFMLAIRDIFKEECLYVKCSTTTVQAFFQKLEKLQKKVKKVVFDELDKWNKKEQTKLYDFFETGITDFEYKTMDDIHIYMPNVQIFCAGNSTKVLNEPLKSRLTIFNFKEYTDEEFTVICAIKLNDLQISEEIITTVIAYKLEKQNKDVRRVLDLAQLIKTSDTPETVRKLMETTDKYQSVDVDYN